MLEESITLMGQLLVCLLHYVFMSAVWVVMCMGQPVHQGELLLALQVYCTTCINSEETLEKLM